MSDDRPRGQQMAPNAPTPPRGSGRGKKATGEEEVTALACEHAGWTELFDDDGNRIGAVAPGWSERASRPGLFGAPAAAVQEAGTVEVDVEPLIGLPDPFEVLAPGSTVSRGGVTYTRHDPTAEYNRGWHRGFMLGWWMAVATAVVCFGAGAALGALT